MSPQGLTIEFSLTANPSLYIIHPQSIQVYSYFFTDSMRKPQGTKDMQMRLVSNTDSGHLLHHLLDDCRSPLFFPLYSACTPRPRLERPGPSEYSKEPSRPPRASAPSSVLLPESPPPWEVLASPALDPFLRVRCRRHRVKDRGASLHFPSNRTAGPLAQHFLPGLGQLTARKCMSP